MAIGRGLFVITSISQVNNFFEILRPYLNSNSLDAVRYQWNEDFKKSKHKNCHCVHLETPRNHPLIFKQTMLSKGHKTVTPIIEGHQCFCVKEECRITHHQQSKLLAGSIAMSIYEESTDDLTGISNLQENPLVRIHFDRRNEFEEKCVCDFAMGNKEPTYRKVQPGPLFHSQLGGKSSSDYRMDIPRIPSFPFDFILLVDLVLRNFYQRHEVSKILEGKVWASWVEESIKCLVSPWGSKTNQNMREFFFS
jgi:hypothetical protein